MDNRSRHDLLTEIDYLRDVLDDLQELNEKLQDDLEEVLDDLHYNLFEYVADIPNATMLVENKADDFYTEIRIRDDQDRTVTVLTISDGTILLDELLNKSDAIEITEDQLFDYLIEVMRIWEDEHGR